MNKFPYSGCCASLHPKIVEYLKKKYKCNGEQLPIHRGIGWGGGLCWYLLNPENSSKPKYTEEHLLSCIPLSQDDLLEEAKRRYPIGTKFSLAHINIHGVCTVKNNEFKYGSTDNICIVEKNRYSGGCVYYKGNWAEIVSEEFKVGDIVKAIENNNRYIIKGLFYKIAIIDSGNIAVVCNIKSGSYGLNSSGHTTTLYIQKKHFVKATQEEWDEQKKREEKRTSIQGHGGLNIGDHLPKEVLKAWHLNGLNRWCNGSHDNKWHKIDNPDIDYINDRKIDSFKEIDGHWGFLVSHTIGIYLKAEGFKKFMEEFNKPKNKDVFSAKYVRCISLEENNVSEWRSSYEIGGIYEAYGQTLAGNLKVEDLCCDVDCFIPATEEEYNHYKLHSSSMKKEEFIDIHKGFIIGNKYTCDNVLVYYCGRNKYNVPIFELIDRNVGPRTIDLPEGWVSKVSGTYWGYEDILKQMKPFKEWLPQKGDWVHRTWKNSGDVDLFQVESATESRITYCEDFYRNGKVLRYASKKATVFGINTDERTTDRKALLHEIPMGSSSPIVAETKGYPDHDDYKMAALGGQLYDGYTWTTPNKPESIPSIDIPNLDHLFTNKTTPVKKKSLLNIQISKIKQL